MTEKLHLSVIIPCYNEKANLQRGVLLEVDNYLIKQSYGSEVIITDDGSTDNSLKILEIFCQTHPRFRLLKNPHAGKSFAIKFGVEKAKGKIILITDMDQSTPLNQIEKLLPYFDRNFAVVIGSRGQKRGGFSLFRQIASNTFRIIRQTILLKNIVDTQCGFKTFQKKAIQKILPKMEIFKKAKKAIGWRVSAYDVELLFVAEKLGFKVKEIPVAWQDRDVSVGKQRNFLKESQEMFKEILRVKINDLRGKYD